jgi:hypothetical protein
VQVSDRRLTYVRGDAVTGRAASVLRACVMDPTQANSAEQKSDGHR